MTNKHMLPDRVTSILSNEAIRKRMLDYTYRYYNDERFIIKNQNKASQAVGGDPLVRYKGKHNKYEYDDFNYPTWDIYQPSWN